MKRLKEYLYDYTSMVEKEFPQMDFMELFDKVWEVMEFWGGPLVFEKLPKNDQFDFIYESIYEGKINNDWIGIKEKLLKQL